VPAFLKDLASGETHRLEDFTLVGRGEGATLRLADAGISRQHASIRREDHDYWVVDLGSVNGSFVNDTALTTARVLRHGDRVRFGSATMVFLQSGSAPPPQTAASDRTQISLNRQAPKATEEVTLLVGDLRDFTRISRLLGTEDVAELLREWYADCQVILRRHGASIDKFIGDCVFAYWHGTDVETRAKALAAAHALRAVEVQSTTPTRLLLKENHGMMLDCRIGIHVGPVALGAMGKGVSTALGDAVNLAFRIEALTRTVEQPVLVSAEFASNWGLGGPDFHSCGLQSIKGLPEPIEVFAPRLAKGVLPEH
jgi:adenylate cyclase